MSVMRTIVLGLAMAVTACESAQSKAARLRGEAATACTTMPDSPLDTAASAVDPDRAMQARRIAHRDSVGAHQAACDVATRNFNEFMK